MSATVGSSCVCPSCGHKYALKPEWVGRKVHCACGAQFLVPSASGGGISAAPTAPATQAPPTLPTPKVSVTVVAAKARPASAVAAHAGATAAAATPPTTPPSPATEASADDGLYDLAPAPAPIKPRISRPLPAAPLQVEAGPPPAATAAPAHAPTHADAATTPSPVSASASTPAHAPIPEKFLEIRPELRAAHRGLTPEAPQVDPADAPMPTWQIILCVVLIAAGTVASFIEAMYFSGPPGRTARTFAQAFVPATGMMLANVLLMVGGVYLISMTLEEGLYDRPLRMVVKICAIGLLPGPLNTIIHHSIGYADVNGTMAGVFTAMILYTTFFRLLFRSPMLQAAACAMGVFIIRATIQYALFRIEGARTGSEI